MPLPQILNKQVDEVRVYGIDFSSKLATGEVITSILELTNDCADLLLEDESTNGTIVYFTLSDGLPCSRCNIHCEVETSSSSILVGDVVLRIIA